MGRIAEALARLARSPYMNSPHVAVVQRYIETGDETALKSLGKGGSQQYSWWEGQVVAALRPPQQWQEDDRRAARAVYWSEGVAPLVRWLDQHLRNERPDEDLMGLLRDVTGASARDLLEAVLTGSNELQRSDGSSTSAGRLVLAHSPEEVRRSLKSVDRDWQGTLASLLARHAPDKAAALIHELLSRPKYGTPATAAGALLKWCGARFEPAVAALYRKWTAPAHRFDLGRVLFEHNPQKYRDSLWSDALGTLGTGEGFDGRIATWVFDTFGLAIVPDLAEKLRGDAIPDDGDIEFLNHAVQVLGAEAEPLLLAELDRKIDIAKLTHHRVRQDADRGDHRHGPEGRV
jgi:hypothetical protein